MKNKFIVLKSEDAEKYLTTSEKYELVGMFEAIDAGRKKDGKTPASDNTYVVINTDEPYFNEVLAIMKEHGHWG
ncbi:hypothetical protein K1X09_34565 [Paenibacillus lautus]|nr:hypothetical protein [Paenibacillus lautus]